MAGWCGEGRRGEGSGGGGGGGSSGETSFVTEADGYALWLGATKTGYKGVQPHGTKFRVLPSGSLKGSYLKGTFPTAVEAAVAYAKAPGELFLFLVAIRHPGAAPGRPRAQKNTPPPRTPPENNILAPQASRVYESTQNKFLECPVAPAAGRRTRAENEPPPSIALEERGAAAHSR